MITALVGVNWGDEGKGRMADLLAERYQVVVRYQGGNNARHTVVTPMGKFVLNLLPSGILHPGVMNIMGPGMAINLESLCQEIDMLTTRGISVTPQQLYVSDKATICLPFHYVRDHLEDEHLPLIEQDHSLQGIGPAYADKFTLKSLRMSDLLDTAALPAKVDEVIAWQNKLFAAFGKPAIDAEETLRYLQQYAGKLKTYIYDTSVVLSNAIGEDKSILFEAQLGALRDIDYGIYPYTSASNTLAAYAPIGAGAPGVRIDEVIGVVKAYSTCLGKGPFVGELTGAEGDRLRAAGHEFGSITGKPRRVGYFDTVASRYGAKLQGTTQLVLTKLDVLCGLESIPVITAYEVDGHRITKFPTDSRLMRAKPVYTRLEGFDGDISRCRTMLELPHAARKYIEFLEEEIGCAIRCISVGAERDAYITR